MNETKVTVTAPVGRPGLIQGLFAPVRGGRLIMTHRDLFTLALIPLVINLVIYIVLFYLGLKYFNTWLDRLLPQSDQWYWIALGWLLTIVILVFLLAVMVFTFTALTSIVASPFHEAMSEKTEKIMTGQDDAPFSLRAILSETGRSLIEALKEVLLYLAVLLLLLLLNLVPIIGSLLFSVLFTLMTIVWLALAHLNFCLARHQYRLRDKLRLIRRNPASVFGYGLAIFGGILVPVLNLAFIPSAVVGGTLLYLDLNPDKN